MKTKNKLKLNLFKGALAVTAFASLPLMTISCNKLDQNLVKEINEYDYNIGNKLNQKVAIKEFDENKNIIETKKTYWNAFGYIEGTVTRVYDGDTFSFMPDHPMDESEKTKGLKVRCKYIDTPESIGPHTPSATELEQSYSDRDTEFAKSLILGKKVRVIGRRTDRTYDRMTGITFFGDNFERCFELEMLKNGFTVSTLSKEDTSDYRIQYDSNVKDTYMGLFAKDFAYAQNYGVLNKQNFFNEFNTAEDLCNTVYSAHGNAWNDHGYYKYLTNSPSAQDSENNFIEWLLQKERGKK
ncbi:thermonuclease family protein [Mycoplasma phocoenae]|uniref:TNase-like domain-containing protein n=1 Tax=Mycoplasma phocoenae TaxID=754517 RepID=A0A858U4C0_9MOLU|nr:thermonuclease family protein [Mycoplasma phocoenae]QJG66919.1 hypothetical protein HGG69_01085 [Mycoplasma phocoenae]